MVEERDERGYTWIRDLRYDEYYYLQDYDNLVVTKVTDFTSNPPIEKWEAIIFEDDSCSKVIGREDFKTKQEAQECLLRIKVTTLKNRGGAEE